MDPITWPYEWFSIQIQMTWSQRAGVARPLHGPALMEAEGVGGRLDRRTVGEALGVAADAEGEGLKVDVEGPAMGFGDVHATVSQEIPTRIAMRGR